MVQGYNSCNLFLRDISDETGTFEELLRMVNRREKNRGRREIKPRKRVYLSEISKYMG